MKIAMASSDGAHVAPHFGRSPHFLIFDVEDGRIVGRHVRTNPFAGHDGGECHGEGQHAHGAGHASILATLRDCSAVLCYGMGPGAVAALSQAGVQPYLLAGKCTPEDAVILFLEGKLLRLNRGSCGCHK